MHLTSLAAELGRKRAIVMGSCGASLSYLELEEQSNQVAHVLQDLGLRPGDHIAILMENQLELFPVVWAAQRSGLFYTPVNWHLTADEAAYIVDNCEATVLVSSSSLEEVAAHTVANASRPVMRLVVGVPAGEEPEGTRRLEDLTAEAPTSPLDTEVEGYYMLYSSGTTGRPKGILPALSGAPFGTGITIDHMMANAFGFGRDSVYLSPGPLYHAAPLGWSLGTIRNGGTVVVMERFEAAHALELVELHRVTHAQFVPTMFVRMLKLEDKVRALYDVSSLRVVVHAGAPCPVEVKQRMIDWLGPKLVEFYAGSEGTGFFMIDSATWLEHPGSVGRPLIGNVHICDDEGRELEVGEIGTVWFSETPRFEYHDDAAKTASAWDERGWTTLGDVGRVDADGFLYLADRRTDLILSGGVNIYPREVEDALIAHPAVADIAVIGVPDDEFGQAVHAVVQPADPAAAGEALAAELIAFARERVAHYKAPRTVDFLDEFPRLPSGKVLKRNLLS
ncbi:acyl-CoA synthetase [Nocardioides pacificus]